GAVAEAGQEHLGAVIELATERIADRVQDLAGHRDGQRREMVTGRVPATVGEPPEQVQHGGWVDTATHPHAELAVAGEDPIVRVERQGGAHLGGLLAQELAPEPQFALPLQVEGLGVGPADDYHPAIEVTQSCPIQASLFNRDGRRQRPLWVQLRHERRARPFRLVRLPHAAYSVVSYGHLGPSPARSAPSRAPCRRVLPLSPRLQARGPP